MDVFVWPMQEGRQLVEWRKLGDNNKHLET